MRVSDERLAAIEKRCDDADWEKAQGRLLAHVATLAELGESMPDVAADLRAARAELAVARRLLGLSYTEPLAAEEGAE